MRKKSFFPHSKYICSICNLVIRYPLSPLETFWSQNKLAKSKHHLPVNVATGWVCQTKGIITDIWFVPVQHSWVLPCQADIITGDELWRAWGCDFCIARAILNVNTLVARSPARCCLVTCSLPAPTANNTAVPCESGFLPLPLCIAPPFSLLVKISNWIYFPLLRMGCWQSSVPVMIFFILACRRLMHKT